MEVKIYRHITNITSVYLLPHCRSAGQMKNHKIRRNWITEIGSDSYHSTLDKLHFKLYTLHIFEQPFMKISKLLNKIMKKTSNQDKTTRTVRILLREGEETEVATAMSSAKNLNFRWTLNYFNQRGNGMNWNLLSKAFYFRPLQLAETQRLKTWSKKVTHENDEYNFDLWQWKQKYAGLSSFLALNLH